jgi:hypothetical protein
MQQLGQLNLQFTDSLNIQIAGRLDKLVRSELSWIIRSNVPYSINSHKSSGHIASFEKIGSLIYEGIQRTSFLIEYHKQQLDKEISKLKTWTTIFILLSKPLFIFTSFNLSRQQYWFSVVIIK